MTLILLIRELEPPLVYVPGLAAIGTLKCVLSGTAETMNVPFQPDGVMPETTSLSPTASV